MRLFPGRHYTKRRTKVIISRFLCREKPNAVVFIFVYRVKKIVCVSHFFCVPLSTIAMTASHSTSRLLQYTTQSKQHTDRQHRRDTFTTHKLTSRRTVARHPMPAARISAVGSPFGAASTCAPRAISCRRTIVDPPALTDVKSGVQPFLSLAFTAAPAPRNIRTISSLSCSHAM